MSTLVHTLRSLFGPTLRPLFTGGNGIASSDFNILTEAGDNLITEASNALVLESAP
jgi:hypothetical protein